MLNLSPLRVSSDFGRFYCAMMRRTRRPLDIRGAGQKRNDERQNDAKTIMDVVAGAHAGGVAAAARRVAVPLAGAGERRRTRAKEERFDRHGQAVLPGF